MITLSAVLPIGHFIRLPIPQPSPPRAPPTPLVPILQLLPGITTIALTTTQATLQRPGFAITASSSIKLRMISVPRSGVERADYFSRIVDVDDWQVDVYWVKFICSRFGRPTVDRFADDYNKKVVHFNFRFFSMLKRLIRFLVTGVVN